MGQTRAPPVPAIQSVPSTESHAKEDAIIADVPGSEASRRDEAHPVKSNADDHIAVEGRDTHGDTVEIIDVPHG